MYVVVVIVFNIIFWTAAIMEFVVPPEKYL